MEGLWELSNTVSNGTIRDPLRPPIPQDWGLQPPPKLQSLLAYLKDVKFDRYIHSVHPNKIPLSP